jgi:hypothetical protein
VDFSSQRARRSSAAAPPRGPAIAEPERGGAAVASVQLVASWAASAPSATADASLAWLRSVYGQARPLIGGGAYVNYADPDLADWLAAYYGANYARLQHVKATYDPDGLFAFPQAIRPT